MPYKTFGNCVHKLNADGSKGKLIKCHPDHAKAVAHLRALYANVEKAMATSKQREKRRERRRAAAQVVKAKEAEVEEVLSEEDELFDESAELEAKLAAAAEEDLTQKDMYGAEMSMMGMGPTSWEEVDELAEARERNHEIQMASYTVQDLVYNILYHPALSVDDKSSAIKAVGDGFATRVQSIMDHPVEKELDMDLLQLEAMIAKEYRSMSVAERVGDWIEKKKLTAGAEKKLSDDDFALPSKRKYPIHDKAHVRNALARAAQMMKRGGEAATDAKAALPKIHAAAKRMGIGMSKEGGIIIEKDASGSWRWVGYPTNNFKDHSGDIITEEAHKEYVDWVNKDLPSFAPVFTSCHAPGTVRESPVDFVGYENGFTVMSGKLTEGEAAALLKASAKCDVGMSHTSWGWRDPASPEHIVKYRAFEVTDLPVETADNPFTFLDLEISKEVDMDQLAYLTELLGSKEKAEQALKLKTSMKQKELQAAGVESKEAKKEEKAPEPSTTTVVNNAPATIDKDEIVAQVLKELDVDGLQEYLSKANEAMEKVPVLEELVKDLSKSRDEELAGMIQPKAAKRFLWSRASENDKNVIQKDQAADEKLVQNATGLGGDEWADAFGVAPLQN